MRIAAVIGAALLALVAVSSEGVAQHKTTADCQNEWRANKTANLARGVTERAYVVQCRGGEASVSRGALAASTPAPTTASAPASSPVSATPAAVSTRPANKILCE